MKLLGIIINGLTLIACIWFPPSGETLLVPIVFCSAAVGFLFADSFHEKIRAGERKGAGDA